MSAKHSEYSAKGAEQQGVSNMSSAAEASSLLRLVAEPRPVGDTVKLAIVRACARVSSELRAFGFAPMDYGRARRIWRKEARRIDAEEMDAIRRAAKDKAVLEDARAEFQRLQDRIAACEAILRLQDPDFHGPSCDALRELARGADRALASRGVIAASSSEDAPC